MALFSRNRKASNRGSGAAFQLMLKARAILRTDDETVVSVSGHDCGDSNCRGARTVVLVMRPDQPIVAVRIDKPIDGVTQSDLSGALAPLVHRHAPATTHPIAATPTRFDW